MSKRKFLIGLITVVAVLATAATSAWAYFTISASASPSATGDTVGAPGVVSVRLYNNQALLSWSTPSTPSGGSFNYTVTRTPNGGSTVSATCSPVSTGTSCTDTGLTPGTAYTWTVTAELLVAGSSTLSSWATNSPSSTTAIAVGPLDHFTWTNTPSSNVTAGTSVGGTLTAYDSGNRAETGYTGTPTLSSSDAQVAFPSGSSYTFQASDQGQANLSGYFTLKTAGSQTLTATDGTATGTSSGITVLAGSPTQAAITPNPAGTSPSTTTNLQLTVQLEDQFGNATVAGAGGVSLSLSRSGTAAYFFASSGHTGGSATLPVSFSSGQGSTSAVWFGDNTAETVTVTATNTGTSTSWGTDSVTVGQNKLIITSTAVSGTATNSPTLGPITVTLESAGGTPVNAGSSGQAVTLQTSSAGPAEFSLTSGGSSISTVTIASGHASATFYYGDQLAGTPTITVSASGLTSGTQQETIAAGPYAALKFVQCSINSGAAGSCGSTVHVFSNGNVSGQVEAVDAYGNVSMVSGSLAIDLTLSNTTNWSVANTPVTISSTANPSSGTPWKVTYSASSNTSTVLTATDRSTPSIATTLTIGK